MDERGFGPPPPPYLCEQERLSYIEKWGGGEEVMGSGADKIQTGRETFRLA